MIEIEPCVLTRRILFCNRSFYFDDSNGASIASRALLEYLSGHGFAAEVICGTIVDGGIEGDPAAWFSERGLPFKTVAGATWTAGAVGVRSTAPPHLRLDSNGVNVTVLHQPLQRYADPTLAEGAEFLPLFDGLLDDFKPQVVLTYGGDGLTRECLARARRRGIATVFALHNFFYRDQAHFADVDGVVVPSRFAAEYYREALGLDCEVVSNFVDMERVRVECHKPKYVTFVNPSVEKGVYPFARIADELGRIRPEIPILVVEGRGTEETVAACGLDLRVHGNVSFMSHTHDPRMFWQVTRLCLMPSLFWESQPLVAVEAMINGIPVIASDRGGLPETLGTAGIVLPLPDSMTPATRRLPTAEEISQWVESIIRLWDERSAYEELRRSAIERAKCWDPEMLGSEHIKFFENVARTRGSGGFDSISRKAAGGTPALPGQGGTQGRQVRSKAVVLVPHLGHIEWQCEQALRSLEESGVRVVRREGCSQIDLARNEMISDALHDGFESILFIDSDIGFDPADALRLLALPELVVCGVYAKKGRRELACTFSDGVEEVVLGPNALGLYPLKYAATGFLRVRSSVLRAMIEALSLPLCNTRWGRGFWPFFLPICVPDGLGGHHYLGEDWSFSRRLAQIGVTPLADTSIRLWHFGRYGYGWEDAGAEAVRYRNYSYHASESELEKGRGSDGSFG